MIWACHMRGQVRVERELPLDAWDETAAQVSMMVSASQRRHLLLSAGVATLHLDALCADIEAYIAERFT